MFSPDFYSFTRSILFQCNAAVGVKAFFDMMHSGPHKVMLFGAACTHVTDPIAKASKHWRLTQVSVKCNKCAKYCGIRKRRVSPQGGEIRIRFASTIGSDIVSKF